METQLTGDRQKLILVTGIIGCVAALIVGATGILMVGQPTDGAAAFVGDTWGRMAGKSPLLLMVGSLAGIGIPLMLVGYWQWYFAMNHVNLRVKRIMMGLLAFGLLHGMVGHFMFGVMGIVQQHLTLLTDNASQSQIISMLEVLDGYFVTPIFLLFLSGVLPAGLMMFVVVIRGQTLFPRWYAIFSPVLAWPVTIVITTRLPEPIGGYIAATWHYPTVIGFVLSTVILMRLVKVSQDEQHKIGAVA